MKPLPGESRFFQSLFIHDQELCLALKLKPCARCGGKLDVANFKRKLRDGPNGDILRLGLCCRRDGCRKRVLPPSMRFLGRRVYSSLTVILYLEFRDLLGFEPEICRRTLGRWREFWRQHLAEGSPFMRWARAQGRLPVAQPGECPKAILLAFGFPAEESWLPALKFLTQFSAS
ncbi:hypothetical protein WDW37_16465 [Bdellovibrionota bacterium FG-1]